MGRGEQLARRRAELVARSARLRGRLTEDGEHLAGRIGAVDRGVSLVRSLAGQPLLLAAGTALLLTLRPLRAFKWAARGTLLLSVARRLFAAFGHGSAARPGSRASDLVPRPVDGDPPTFI